MKHDVTMFDVGHGECILVRSERLRGFLVDCGATRPQKHCQVPNLIETYLPATSTCGFAISHYHDDHYNLFPCFARPHKLFSNIYVPDMPAVGPGRHVTHAIMEFLALASLIDFRNYRILPDIFRLLKKRPIPRRKGQTIREANLSFYVFWPDIDHRILRTPSIIKKAKMMRQKIKPWLEKYGIPTEYEGDNLLAQFFEYLVQELSLEETFGREREELEKTLRDLEETFKDLGNLLSLAFKTYDSRENEKLLFLSDLDNRVLDRIHIARSSYTYDFIQAAHHGTEFGKSLHKMSTEYLLVSRNQEEFHRINPIHEGYFSQMRFRFMLSTECLGSCHIKNGEMLIFK